VALSGDGDGLPVPGLPLAGGQARRVPRLLVAVPPDIEAIRLSEPGRAAAWRAALRDVLSPLIAGGARVTGFDRSGWYVVSMGREER
jgi:predicted GNAT superfamily acetyltransferase